MDNKFYSVEEVAKALGLSPATVRGYCSKGKLPSSRAGRGYRIPSEALYDWAVSDKNELKYKSKNGVLYKIEICSLSQPGSSRPSFFHVFDDEGDTFFIELLISEKFSEKDTTGFSEIIGFVQQAIDSDIEGSQRVIIGKQDILYENIS